MNGVSCIMTKDEFYRNIQKSIEEEHDAGSTYIELANNAMEECDRDTLMEMARQEVMHRANLEWINMKKDM